MLYLTALTMLNHKVASNMISIVFLVLLTSLINLEVIVDAEDVAPNTLPPIWPTIRSDKSYRAMFQLQMFETSERITVEEWGSFDKQLFRLDLISGEMRTTYLTNGNTGEIFRYKPFVCDQLTADSVDLGVIGALFKGYLGDKKDSTVAYGLGPLWLRAMQGAAKVTPMSDSSAEYRRHKFLGRFNGYELSFATDTTQNLRFYFLNAGQQTRFVDAVEWVDTAKSTKNGRVNPNKVEARAKLWYTDLNKVDDSIFALPIGYGCQRQAQFDHPMNIDIGLGLLHEGGPNMAVLEATTSLPRDYNLNSWISRKYTLYLMRGSLRLGGLDHYYYVTTTQGIDPSTSRLKRTRKVWSSTNSTATEALVYNIDETSGDCRATRTDFQDLVRLPFPGSQSVTPEALSIDLIISLFNDNTGYHLIRERVSKIGSSGSDLPSTNVYREVFYEKRLDRFELKNADGKIVWLGPISIVKRVKSVAVFIQNVQSTPLVDSYQTTLTLFFYASDFDRILYKAVLDLIGQDELDIRIMQKELDVGECYKEDQKEDMIIKYPMESQDLARKLSAVDDLVEERFLLGLFGTTVVLPTQVSGVEISFDNFFMYIKMSLIDLPLTHIFDIKRGLELKKTNTGPKMMEKLSSSIEKCASSCDFYSCHAFSYDYSTHKCMLQLMKGEAGWRYNYAADLYKRPAATSNFMEHHLKPRYLFDMFQELVSTGWWWAPKIEIYDKEKQRENVPLTIRLDTELVPELDSNEKDYIELKPISVQSDMDSMNEFVREEQANHTSSKEANSSIVIVHDASNLRLQYSILFEGRSFESKNGQLFEGVSFDGCSELCESSDCRSFSYCEPRQTCIVTNIHMEYDIKKATISDPLSSVHILDYLSKFEDFGWTQQPLVTKSVYVGHSLQDCASFCMEEQSFNCQGFYHCRKKDSPIDNPTATCLLQDKHIEEGPAGEKSIPRFETTYGLATSLSSNICSYFSRSYLAQFNSYIGKGLKFQIGSTSKEVLTGIDVAVGLGAEQCAKKCIEESCLAFHVCFDNVDSNPVCSITKNQIRKFNLSSRRRCTAFVLSDKSQFNMNKTQLADEVPDREALDKPIEAPAIVIDAEQQEAAEKDAYASVFHWFWDLEQVKQLRQKSNWGSKFMSLLWGALFGLVCGILWIQRDSVYNLATRVSSHYRARS